MYGLNKQMLAIDIDRWLHEDIGTGDITSLLTIRSDQLGKATILAKDSCVVAGIAVAEAVFAQLDPTLGFVANVADGQYVEAGTNLATVTGSMQSILAGERLALNLVQRMSGIATLTSKFVAEVAGTNAKILDTRKTTPGLRYLEKYAVTVGGGRNHRFGLYDGVLIKDNHIAALGSVFDAVTRLKGDVSHYLKVEVEVSTLADVEQAIAAGADAVLLDNMKNDEMTEAVSLVDHKLLTEASGNMSLARVLSVAITGVDLISVGALTHSVPAVDISLNIS